MWCAYTYEVSLREIIAHVKPVLKRTQALLAAGQVDGGEREHRQLRRVHVDEPAPAAASLALELAHIDLHHAAHHHIAYLALITEQVR